MKPSRSWLKRLEVAEATAAQKDGGGRAPLALLTHAELDELVAIMRPITGPCQVCGKGAGGRAECHHDARAADWSRAAPEQRRRAEELLGAIDARRELIRAGRVDEIPAEVRSLVGLEAL